jgi:hypothetical protein
MDFSNHAKNIPLIVRWVVFIVLFIGCINPKPTITKPDTKPDTVQVVKPCSLQDTLIKGLVVFDTDTTERDLPYYKATTLRYFAIKDSCGVWYKHNGWKLAKQWMLYAEFYEEDLIVIHDLQKKGALNENFYNDIISDTLRKQ